MTEAIEQRIYTPADDPKVTLSLNTFEAEIEIGMLYENIDLDAV